MMFQTVKQFDILIVDDSLMNISTLKRILSKVGYNVMTATSGEEALRMVGDMPPSLILLDIMMPGMNGMEVLEKLKARKDTHTIPVLFLTGKTDDETKIKAFEMGAVDYITKPFNPREVKARVKVHLKSHHAEEDIVYRQAERLQQVIRAQESILINPSDLPDAGFSVFHKSLVEAGGDFYDVLQTGENMFSYLVSDISGHDIESGFLAPSLKALMQQNCSPIHEPEETLRLMNRVLVKILPEDKYLSFVFLALNRNTGIAEIINAANPPVVFVSANKKECRVVSSNSDILGMFEDAQFQSETFPVKKGDRFVIFTDGLIESSHNETLWTENLEKPVKTIKQILSETSSEDVPKKIYESFMSGTKPSDDIVIMNVEVL